MNDSAAICYKAGVEEAMKCEDKSSLAYLYNNLSVLYCEMERYGESISYAKKAQANALQGKDTTEYLSALANEGINYAKSPAVWKNFAKIKFVFKEDFYAMMSMR